MNKHNNSQKKSEPISKRAKPRGSMRRDTKEVLAELVAQLKEKLDPKKLAATSAGEKPKRGELRPNLAPPAPGRRRTIDAGGSSL